MSGIDGKGSLFTQEKDIILMKNGDGKINEKTMKDGLIDVTKHLDGLLIDKDKDKKKDWDSEEIEESAIPRIKDHGDRLASSLLDDRNGAGSPQKEIKETEKIFNNDENRDKGGEPEEEEDALLRLNLDEPSPEVMEYARRELGETDEVKCQTLQDLRDMIYERGECNPHRVDDAFLIRFLRARNFNVNRAHRLVVRYFDFKEQYPDIHQGVNPLKMRHIGDDDVMTVPDYKTQCGRRMMIYRIGNWDPKKYGIEELLKATVIILELGILEPTAQVLGGVVLFDLRGITMAHAWTITPQIARMVMALMVSAFPMKTHAIHILHQSWVFDMMFAMFTPLLDANMSNRIFYHGDDMTSLHKHIAPTCLPKMYGGFQEELPYYKWIDSLSTDPRLVKAMYQLGYVIPDDILKTIQHLL